MGKSISEISQRALAIFAVSFNRTLWYQDEQVCTKHVFASIIFIKFSISVDSTVPPHDSRYKIVPPYHLRVA